MTEKKSSELNIYDAPSALTVLALCLFPPLGLAIIKFGYREWDKTAWVRAVAATWVILLSFAIAGGRFSIQQIRALESRQVSSAGMQSATEFGGQDNTAGEYQHKMPIDGADEGSDEEDQGQDQESGNSASSGNSSVTRRGTTSTRSNGSSTSTLNYTTAPGGQQLQSSGNKKPTGGTSQNPTDPSYQDRPNTNDPLPQPGNPGGNEPGGDTPEPGPDEPGGGDEPGSDDPEPEPTPDEPETEGA